MTVYTVIHDQRSSLYRLQIENIGTCMGRFVSQTLFKPLQNMTAFTGIKEAFSKMKDDAFINCTHLDNAYSVHDEDKASTATVVSMTQLIHLKNQARELIAKEA